MTFSKMYYCVSLTIHDYTYCCETKLNKLYGMVKCYEYQSCEDPQWTSTNAYHLCQYLKNYISDQLIDTEDTWDYRSEEKVI